MNYLINRYGWYYFNRRVPLAFKAYDNRPLVRIALNTDSRKEAMRLALIHNDQLEKYWKKLAGTGNKHEFSSYENIVRTAQALGFGYLPCQELAKAPLEQLYDRLVRASQPSVTEQQITALLGGIQEPTIKISDTIDRYIDYSKGKTVNKSPNQLRKWVNPRKLAIKTFIECVGDKELNKLTRDDVLKFRDQWISRIEKKEELAPVTANKNIILVKTIIETVNDNLNLELDTKKLFRKIILPDDEEGRRLPFETDYILSTLLNPENLKGLNEQARWSLYAIAETGAGVSEQVGLLTEDIILDHDVPHIVITSRSKKALKTKYRRRIIPLVGFALDAFKACPNGFSEYRDRPDSLSAVLSKYLRENNLIPSKKHTVYSLRHSFQDRLLAVNAPDRVQADLMGHKFNRPAYGDGASLEHKWEWLKKIQLRN